MNPGHDEWVRLRGFEMTDTPMVLLLLSRQVEREMAFLDASDDERPVVLQRLVDAVTREKYPGTQLIGVQFLAERGCWGLQCVHQAFPRTPHGQLLPQWPIVVTREGPHTSAFALDDRKV